jgi:hypothetical protein
MPEINRPISSRVVFKSIYRDPYGFYPWLALGYRKRPRTGLIDRFSMEPDCQALWLRVSLGNASRDEDGGLDVIRFLGTALDCLE